MASSEGQSDGQPDGRPRPLRSDAQRNRELLLAAARELFAGRGVDVPLEEIARRAGVSVGTLYNRFPSRAELVEAVFTDRMATIAELAEKAATADDPWDGFAGYLTGICELQAADRGFNEVAARVPATLPATQRLRETALAALTEVFDRAKRAGALRTDVTVEDLAFVVWGISRTVEMTADVAPRLWQRHLGLLLDGFRATAAHPLPEPPLTPGRSHVPGQKN
jgi:AcrR family transcriptional regulator